MRYLAAYMLLKIANKDAEPSVADIKKVLQAGDCECDDAQAKAVIDSVSGSGKSIDELIATGKTRMSSLSAGSGAGAGAAAAGGAAAAKVEEKKEESEEEIVAGFGFDSDSDWVILFSGQSGDAWAYSAADWTALTLNSI